MLDEFRSKGLHRAREFNRAHILAALDRKIPEPVIMQVLSVGRTAIWRTRAAYLKAGRISRCTMRRGPESRSDTKRTPRRR